MEKQQNSRSSFTGTLGFILAAAGSAIGLGNLWRFPILAAKDGGGIYVLVYILLAVTFGFALMLTEIAVGRKTSTTPLQAYGVLNGKFKFLGTVATAVPMIIFPYYCVIGGWVTKYAATYATGGASGIYSQGSGDYFDGFIKAGFSPILWFLVFMALTGVIVLLGVEKGIEKASKFMMPVLLFLVIGIAVYTLTLKYTDPVTGDTRNALQGLKIYLVPDFTGLTVSGFITVLLDAAGQLFYSMSIAMGIMITYGSYCKKDANLIKSVNSIEIFDTGVALLAGLIVIPSVFVFQGVAGLSKSGPGLMFVSLPAVFEQMGVIGHIVGALFFVLVLFAALTSSISLMEAVVASFIDKFKWPRLKATVVTFVISLVLGLLTCLGYNALYFEVTLPNGSVGQILDIFDYISNNLLLPVVAFLTCLLVGWFAKPESVLDEVKLGLEGKKFGREGLYRVMIKYVAPVILLVILLQSFNVFSFLD